MDDSVELSEQPEPQVVGESVDDYDEHDDEFADEGSFDRDRFSDIPLSASESESDRTDS